MGQTAIGRNEVEKIHIYPLTTTLKKVVSLPYGISINGQEDFNEVGEVINSLLDKRLRMLARDLVVYGELIRGQFLQDL